MERHFGVSSNSQKVLLVGFLIYRPDTIGGGVVMLLGIFNWLWTIVWGIPNVTGDAQPMMDLHLISTHQYHFGLSGD